MLPLRSFRARINSPFIAPSTCIAHTIAILVHDLLYNIRPPPPRPPLMYAIDHTILVMDPTSNADFGAATHHAVGSGTHRRRATTLNNGEWACRSLLCVCRVCVCVLICWSERLPWYFGRVCVWCVCVCILHNIQLTPQKLSAGWMNRTGAIFLFGPVYVQFCVKIEPDQPLVSPHLSRPLGGSVVWQQCWLNALWVASPVAAIWTSWGQYELRGNLLRGN